MTTDTDPDIDAHVVEDLARRLEGAFRWIMTPQGHEYWAAVADNLRALAAAAKAEQEAHDE